MDTTSMISSDELSSTPSLVKRVQLFEKEKGGTGSTGSLMSVAHMYLRRGVPLILIEASTTQNDIANAFSDQQVEILDLLSSDAQDRLVDIIAGAPAGARILANIPGGRIEEVGQLHEMLNFVVQSDELKAETAIIWTMGLDPASRDTLYATLECDLPGPVFMNLPKWHGPPEAFLNVDQDLRDRIAATGGSVFNMPKLPIHIYNQFRIHEMAIHRVAATAMLGTRMAIQLWERQVEFDAGWCFE